MNFHDDMGLVSNNINYYFLGFCPEIFESRSCIASKLHRVKIFTDLVIDYRILVKFVNFEQFFCSCCAKHFLLSVCRYSLDIDSRIRGKNSYSFTLYLRNSIEPDAKREKDHQKKNCRSLQLLRVPKTFLQILYLIPGGSLKINLKANKWTMINTIKDQIRKRRKTSFIS